MKTIDMLRRAAFGVAILGSLAICGCDDSASPPANSSSTTATSSANTEKTDLDAALEKAKIERRKLETQLFDQERRFSDARQKFRDALTRFDEKERQEIEQEFKAGNLSEKNRSRSEIVRLFGDWKKLLAAEKKRKETRDLYDRLNSAIASGENKRDEIAIDDSATVDAVEGLEVLVDYSQGDALTPDDLELAEDAQNSEDVFAPNADSTKADQTNADSTKTDQTNAAQTDAGAANDDADSFQVDAEDAENVDVWKKYSKVGNKGDYQKIGLVELDSDADEPKRPDSEPDASDAAPAKTKTRPSDDKTPIVVPVDAEADLAFLSEFKENVAKLSTSDSAWFEIVVFLENANRIEPIAQRRERSAELDKTLNALEKCLQRQAESDPSGTETIQKRFQALVAPEKVALEQENSKKKIIRNLSFVRI